jgi:hypothetical protein
MPANCTFAAMKEIEISMVVNVPDFREHRYDHGQIY